MKLKRITPPQHEPVDDFYEPLKFGPLEIRVRQCNSPDSLKGQWFLSMNDSVFMIGLEAALAEAATRFETAAAGIRAMIGDYCPDQVPLDAVDEAHAYSTGRALVLDPAELTPPAEWGKP